MRFTPKLIADQFILVSIVSFMGALHWSFDLPAHFRPQLMVGGVLIAWLAFLLKLHRRAMMCAILAVFHAIPLVPYLFPQADAGTASMRIMGSNLRYVHVDVQKFQAEVKKENPDIILLTELPPDLSALLSSLEISHPFRAEYPRKTLFDVLLLSRWPVKEFHVERASDSALPVLSATVCKDDASCIHVIGMHVVHALSPQETAQQAPQLDTAVKLVKPGQPTVLMGDFNLTPWSAAFQNILKRTALRDSATSRLLEATWPVGALWGGLIIDHVLISSELGIVASRVGEDIGSDHFPVIADLALRKP